MLNPDFSEFVALLNAHEVHYLIVGGYAVALHGHPRYTKDLDVWIARNPTNAARLMEVLDAFGFGAVGLTAEDFLIARRVVQLGYPPSRIDLLTDLEGVTFDESYSERETLNLDGIEIPYIGLERLKQNKRALGRHQDLADLENLE